MFEKLFSLNERDALMWTLSAGVPEVRLKLLPAASPITKSVGSNTDKLLIY
jgi:hypothetical protein